MSALGAVFAGISSACVALALSGGGQLLGPLLASLAGVGWAAVLVFRPKTPVHGLFLFLALGAAGFVAAQGRTLHALAACTAALFAWDAATMQRLFSSLPREGRRGIVRRYSTHALVTAAVAILVPLVGLFTHPFLRFPAALGLSLGVLTLLGLTLWQGGRFAETPPAKPVDENEVAGDRPLAPPATNPIADPEDETTESPALRIRD